MKLHCAECCAEFSHEEIGDFKGVCPVCEKQVHWLSEPKFFGFEEI